MTAIPEVPSAEIKIFMLKAALILKDAERMRDELTHSRVYRNAGAKVFVDKVIAGLKELAGVSDDPTP